jgi:hypothetical protein
MQLRFDAFRRFLRTARDAFSCQSNIGERLAGCGPLGADIVRQVLGALTEEERRTVDPALFEFDADPASSDVSELLARAVANPVLSNRLLQKFFVADCSSLLGELNRTARERVLSEARELISYLPYELGLSGLATTDHIGWFATHPQFVGNLWFVPGLVQAESRALLHQVPKVGGTSVTRLLVDQVPSACALFPCNTFVELVSRGGALYGVDVLNDLSERPRPSLVFAGHFNLSVTLQRAAVFRLRCVSQFGSPDRLLSSGLRHYLSLAASEPSFAHWVGLDRYDVERLASVLRNGTGTADQGMRDIIDRTLASPAFQSHFRDPLTKWFLPPDTERFAVRLIRFESLVSKVGVFTLHEFPSERCLSDLGLEAEPGARLGRSNVSGFSPAALSTAVGGDGWLLDRFRSHDLIGLSERLYCYLLEHHGARVAETSVG